MTSPFSTVLFSTRMRYLLPPGETHHNMTLSTLQAR